VCLLEVGLGEDRIKDKLIWIVFPLLTVCRIFPRGPELGPAAQALENVPESVLVFIPALYK